MTDYQRNQQGLLLNKRIKQIKIGWEARINMLQDAIVACEKINERRGDVTLKSFVVVKEL
jgi:hypothetical protein